ncbi:hypothetical protein ACEXQD_18295 [Herbiconiux sp. P15]|uniref:hypothetical protein n=1 Tax=Herbiconiux liukaitaii TaxID=3342799 RepID=UPI0035B8A675
MGAEAEDELELALQREWSRDLILQSFKVIMAAVEYSADGTISASKHMAIVRESRKLTALPKPEDQEPVYLVAYHMAGMLVQFGESLGIDMESYAAGVATAIRGGVDSGHVPNLWPQPKPKN